MKARKLTEIFVQRKIAKAIFDDIEKIMDRTGGIDAIDYKELKRKWLE